MTVTGRVVDVYHKVARSIVGTAAIRARRRLKEFITALYDPVILISMPIPTKRLGVRTVAGVDFTPIRLSTLHHLRESMSLVLNEFGLGLVDVQEHVFRPALRQAGPISDLGGVIAPKMMAQNAVAAISVKINGAETGTAKDYKKAKTRIDGIGATTTHKALTVTGDLLAKFGYHMVTVATEGTPSHSKAGESAIGNPTISIGTMYPGRIGLEKETVGPSGKVFTYKDSNPIFIGMDVVECTEAAATTLEAYQQISGRTGQPKDTGAVCVISVYDQPAVLADTYARKFIVGPEIARALRDAGREISLEKSLEENFRIISEVTGRPISDFGVMSLGPKPRIKGGKLKNSRPGAEILFAELERIGVTKTFKFDDGDTPAVMLMVKGSLVRFDNGETGPVDVFVGDGGVFENVTAARTVADVCEDGAAEYAAVWRYVYKPRTKTSDPDTYFTAHEIPEEGMGPYEKLGIDPSGSHKISDTLPNDGDRAFIVSSITVNKASNPYAIAPEVNRGDNTVTVYQEVVSSDGSVVGRYYTFRARGGIQAMEQRLAPILPDLMRIEDIDTLRATLQDLKTDVDAMDALKANLRMYLYSLVGDSRSADEPPFYLLMEQLLLRRLANTLDDQKALVVLRFATKEFPELFQNPSAVADSKSIIASGRYTLETDADSGVPITIKLNDLTVLKPQGKRHA